MNTTALPTDIFKMVSSMKTRRLAFSVVVLSSLLFCSNCQRSNKSLNEISVECKLDTSIICYDLSSSRKDTLYSYGYQSAKKIDSSDWLLEQIGDEVNFYEAFYDSDICETYSYKVITVFYYYDYMRMLLLVTQSKSHDSIISIEPLTFIGGDGGLVWKGKSCTQSDYSILRMDYEIAMEYEDDSSYPTVISKDSTVIRLSIDESGIIKTDTLGN